MRTYEHTPTRTPARMHGHTHKRNLIIYELKKKTGKKESEKEKKRKNAIKSLVS